MDCTHMNAIGPTAALLLSALAGAGIATQSGTNAVLGRMLGHPMWATFWQFAAGTVLISVIMILMRVPVPTFATAAANGPWWIWIGFITGSAFVVAGLSFAPVVGVGGFIAALVAGQMLASLTLDHFGLVGLAVRPLTAVRALGAAMIIGGVMLIQLPRN
jgi:bacterial/archaeal transporter family-2 protein